MWTSWGLCRVVSQPLPGLYLGGELGPCWPSPGLSPGSDQAGENALFLLCTAEGAPRPCLLEKRQLLWLEGGPGLELAVACWVF